MDSVYHQLQEQDLKGLAEMCANVARSDAAGPEQSDTAHALRIEWIRLKLDRSLDGSRAEAEESLKKRMVEFLAGVPAWMWSGV